MLIKRKRKEVDCKEERIIRLGNCMKGDKNEDNPQRFIEVLRNSGRSTRAVAIGSFETGEGPGKDGRAADNLDGGSKRHRLCCIFSE
jgi:hypothetical protein